MTEAELISGCINGKNDCQRMLFEKHAGTMMSICLRYSNDEHVAQDILQMGFIKVFENIQQFKNEGSFEGWMKKIFVNIAIRQFNKKKLNYSNLDDVDTQVTFEDPSVISRISENEIHKMIRMLPDGYRTVFNLNIIEGYSHEEIAAILNIQQGTCRTQLLKARKMLQGLISKHFNLILI